VTEKDIARMAKYHLFFMEIKARLAWQKIQILLY
jgi:hypothetical protein